jgi:polyisoprenoid-binding protein YceI
MRPCGIVLPTSVRQLLLGLPLLSLCLTAVAEPARYKLDPDHLTVAFLVDHIGYAKVLGMFLEAEGEYDFDEATGVAGELRVLVRTTSVFTNHEKRDEHLRSPDFLNSAEFPEMVFTASGVNSRGERQFLIEGELELLGTSRPMTLQATWNKSGEYPFGGGLLSAPPYAMGVSARGSFRRSDFGMSYSVDNGWVGDEVELIIEFEAQRQ